MKKILIILLLFMSYNLSFGQWVQLGESIQREKGAESFGHTLAISGDGLTVIVGSKTSPELAKNAGKIEVFRYINSKWEEIGDILGNKLNDEFGWAVDISHDGNIIAVSARDGQYGHVRVYKYANEKWIQMGDDLDKNGRYFGYTISLNDSGNVVVISAIHNDSGAPLGGQVTVFEFKDNKWEQKGQDINGDTYYGYLGTSTSINGEGNIIALNNNGFIKIFKYGNNKWSQIGDDIDGNDKYTNIDLSKDGLTIAFGMGSDQVYNYDGGQTIVYKFNGTEWEQLGQTFYNHSGRIAKINGDGNIIATAGTAGIDEEGQTFFNPKVYSLFYDQWRSFGLKIDEEENNNFIGSRISISDDGFTIAIGGITKTSKFGYTEDLRVYTHSTRTFVKNHEEHQKINLYPNPANDLVSIDVDRIDLMNEFTIIDINGKSVYNSTSPNSNLTIDLKQFLSGVCYLIVKNKEGTTREKLIIQ
jgi:type IX secretion system substrate protein